MRNREIAIGLVVAGIAANAAPAVAETGGVHPGKPGAAVAGSANPGGIAAGESSGSGGIPAEHPPRHSHLAAVIRNIKSHMRQDTSLESFTLDPSTLDADAEDASIIVTPANDPEDGMEIVNPLAILSADGGHVAAYAGLEGDSLYVIAANKAKVTGFIGNVAVDVDVESALTPHTLDLAPDTGAGAAGFTDETGAGFAMMP